MKNPMSPEEMKQAIDDNAAECDMQVRPIGDKEWNHRKMHMVGKALDLFHYEYRRKPEPFIAYVNEYENNVFSLFKTLDEALKYKGPFYICTTRLIRDPTHSKIEPYKQEDPDWVESEPEDPNPWRKIVPGEWPKCKPYVLIDVKYPDSRIKRRIASRFAWDIVKAIEWRYAEDE